MSKVVFVGTKNPIKLQAVKMVLEDFDVVGLDVDSQVGIQPMNDGDTIHGALTRARSLPQQSLRIGLEAGVQIHNDLVFLVNWGVLIDENDKVYYAGGTRLPLPDVVGKILFQDQKELAVIMDSYYHTNNIKHNEGAVGFFTHNLVKRVDIFTHIVKLLYGQYLKEGFNEA